MKKKDVIEFYGSAAEAGRKLGISRAAVGQWPDIVPSLRAYQIQAVTRGKIKRNPSDYK